MNFRKKWPLIGLAVVLSIACPLIVRAFQEQPLGPVYSYRFNGSNDSWVFGTMTMYAAPQNSGVPLLQPSNLVDTGNGLTYKGTPFTTGGAQLPSTPGVVYALTATTSRVATNQDYASIENLSYSANPSFSTTKQISRIALSGNMTFAIGSGVDGQNKCLMFAHDSSSTVYVISPPTNVHGFFTVGSTASKDNQQCYTYFATDGFWVAASPGVINQ